MTSKRLSLEDVARAAGVSKATVDRVINGRPGVRDDTAKLVRATLRDLGYSQSALMSEMKQKPLRIEIHVPHGDNNFFVELRTHLEKALAQVDVRLEVHWVEYSVLEPLSVIKAISEVSSSTDCVMLVAVDNQEVTDAIDLLVERGTKVITYAADAPRSRRTAYVGLDNFAAGRLAGDLMGRFLGARMGSIAILAGDPSLRDQIDRVSGFNQIMLDKWSDRTVDAHFESRYGQEADDAIIRSLLAKGSEVVGIYVAGMSNRAVLRELASVGKDNRVVIGHEYTKLSRTALLAGLYDAVIALDIPQAAREMVEVALGANRERGRLLEARIVMKENLTNYVDL